MENNKAVLLNSKNSNTKKEETRVICETSENINNIDVIKFDVIKNEKFFNFYKRKSLGSSTNMFGLEK